MSSSSSEWVEVRQTASCPLFWLREKDATVTVTKQCLFHRWSLQPEISKLIYWLNDKPNVFNWFTLKTRDQINLDLLDLLKHEGTYANKFASRVRRLSRTLKVISGVENTFSSVIKAFNSSSTSKTVRAKGWARYSEDWRTFFRLSPFRSTLHSMCNFESTQYNLPLIRSMRMIQSR